jgi:hypothetical protein
MRLRRSARLILPLVLLCVSGARADFLEVKNKGIMNGTIISETDKEVKLKDADGNIQTFARSDVLYVEKEEQQPKKPAGLPMPKIDLKKLPDLIGWVKKIDVRGYLANVAKNVPGQTTTELAHPEARKRDILEEPKVTVGESARGVYSENIAAHSEDIHKDNGSSHTRHFENQSSSKYAFKTNNLSSTKSNNNDTSHFGSL